MSGFQGYVTSQPVQGFRVPQHVQNLVIRDYCQSRGMRYLLSGTEYAIPGSALMLNQMIARLDQLEGVVLYSMFQLPEEARTRLKIYEQFISKEKSMHFAVESLSISKREEIQRIEDIWTVSRLMQDTPSIQDQL